MREIKFRYVLKVSYSTEDEPYQEDIETMIFFLYEIERGEFSPDMLQEPYTIRKVVARNQYTGLKDKNGKEIYEGDIVIGHHQNYPLVKRSKVYKDNENENADAYTGVVKWSTDHLDYRLHVPRGIWWSLHLLYPTEVIGSIYENPELLENKE